MQRLAHRGAIECCSRGVACRATTSEPTTSGRTAKKTERNTEIHFGGNRYTAGEWDDALAQGKLKQPPAAPPASPSAREQPSIRSIMQFDGPAPELINGRAAMLGFAAAVLGELHTGESVLNLLNDVPQGVLVVFTLILVGSLFPMGLAVHPHHKAHGFFTASNEIWGGRMVGFVSLLATEALKGGTALF